MTYAQGCEGVACRPFAAPRQTKVAHGIVKEPKIEIRKQAVQ